MFLQLQGWSIGKACVLHFIHKLTRRHWLAHMQFPVFPMCFSNNRQFEESAQKRASGSDRIIGMRLVSSNNTKQGFCFFVYFNWNPYQAEQTSFKFQKPPVWVIVCPLFDMQPHLAVLTFQFHIQCFADLEWVYFSRDNMCLFEESWRLETALQTDLPKWEPGALTFL